MFQFAAFAVLHLWIQCRPVRESRDQHSFDSSPELFAVFHALQSLLTPRHPPCALSSLDHINPTLLRTPRSSMKTTFNENSDAAETQIHCGFQLLDPDRAAAIACEPYG